MRPESLDALYGELSAALGRIGEQDASLFLATLVLELIGGHHDANVVADAIARAERLVRLDDAGAQGR